MKYYYFYDGEVVETLSECLEEAEGFLKETLERALDKVNSNASEDDEADEYPDDLKDDEKCVLEWYDEFRKLKKTENIKKFIENYSEEFFWSFIYGAEFGGCLEVKPATKKEIKLFSTGDFDTLFIKARGVDNVLFWKKINLSDWNNADKEELAQWKEVTGKFFE